MYMICIMLLEKENKIGIEIWGGHDINKLKKPLTLDELMIMKGE